MGTKKGMRRKTARRAYEPKKKNKRKPFTARGFFDSGKTMENYLRSEGFLE